MLSTYHLIEKRMRESLSASSAGIAERSQGGGKRGRAWALGALRAMIGALVLGIAGPAGADENFAVKDNLLLGNNDLPLAELPSGLVPSTVFAEPGAQDLWVLGLLGSTITGQTPLAVGIRYGRVLGRSEARPVLGPLELPLPTSAISTATVLRGASARTATGPIIGVATGQDSTVYFLDARSARLVTVGALGQILDLKNGAASVGKVGAMAGLGTKLYAIDTTKPVVAQINLMTGTVAACRVDSQPLALRVSSGRVLALTDKGIAQLADDCSSTTAASQSPKVDPIPTIAQALVAERFFHVSERSLEMSFSVGSPGTTRTRRGASVQLVGGSAITLTLNRGTCVGTNFYVGDVLANPVASPMMNLSAAVPRLAFYAEQAYPGEDCVAFISNNADGSEALLRIRANVDGLGSNVMMVDRSWSTERSLLGIGNARNSEDTRIHAERQALVGLVSSLSVLGATGPWAVMPFTDDAPSSVATPQTGFSSIPELANPDHARGLRLKGLAGVSSDVLVPGGPTNMVQAMRSALTRMDAAAMLPQATAGPQRRLWLLTDGSSGKAGYGDFYKLLPLLLRGNVTLHLLGAGGLDNDPLLPNMLSQAYAIGGDRLFGPGRGIFGINHTVSSTVESTVTQVVRSVLRGRPIGNMARGDIGAGKTLVNTFKMNRNAAPFANHLALDPWILVVAAWDQSDAMMKLEIAVKGTLVTPRCVQGAHTLVCAFSNLDGDVIATLSGSRPGGSSATGVLRSYISTSGPAGDVHFFPSFSRSLWKSGERVRVQVQLTERGLPLRLAKVRATVNGPNNAVGTVISASKSSEQDIQNLIQSNGDLSPGQSKAELIDPLNLPGLKPIGNLTLADDASGGDLEAQDGIYTAEFPAFVPGSYVVDVHVDYTGLFVGNVGSIEDRLISTVVVGLDQMRTNGGSRSETLASGLRIRFAPQDSGRNLLGPGQGAAMSFFQAGKLLPGTVGDYLDGSYRVDLTGVDATKPVELAIPASRIQIYNPSNPNPGDTGGGASTGCSASATRAPLGGPLGAPLLLLLSLLALRRRRA